jgi:hypothetical protein
MSVDPAALWRWLPVGYALTVALEAPVLLAGLGTARPDVQSRPAGLLRRGTRRYTVRQRLAAACWLTGVTYPVVAVALPVAMWPHASYLTYIIVAETFAIAAECLLFKAVWGGSRRDRAVVALANVVSASLGWLFTG